LTSALVHLVFIFDLFPLPIVVNKDFQNLTNSFLDHTHTSNKISFRIRPNFLSYLVHKKTDKKHELVIESRQHYCETQWYK